VSTSTTAPGAPSAAQTDRTRARVRLMIDITARAGSYRRGLLAAADAMGPEEALIIADLEEHGLQVPQLRDVLCGGHVLVDDPALYDAWAFPAVSHHRISSHHHDVDKSRYPDIGMRGPVVREKLHGRTQTGTWVQLEKTPAAIGAKKLPSLDDLKHLADYVVYRVTRSNVGPWGRSKTTERRPMYLAPDLAVATDLDPAVAAHLLSTLAAVESDDDTTAVSEDLAARIPAPLRHDPVAELRRADSGRAGRGLFGNSEVWVSETPSAGTAAALSATARPPGWQLPPATSTQARPVSVAGRVVTLVDRTGPDTDPRNAA